MRSPVAYSALPSVNKTFGSGGGPKSACTLNDVRDTAQDGCVPGTRFNAESGTRRLDDNAASGRKRESGVAHAHGPYATVGTERPGLVVPAPANGPYTAHTPDTDTASITGHYGKPNRDAGRSVEIDVEVRRG
jgi:hypothetical protein